ncbi:DMT family transporter [Aliiroseovarius sp. KMU-50]|uniref:DMT family transporter n=1 Tax=Aliiroseovarius salicola TaxID=3009082 RepID=A0ABT4W569_9RHOB|nr:DMT family transporter [Aliiroseovarius sp. KMU-50]MDA5095651.1 DMT family transporter [Aliiroseovarius sp. KMU-50]
MPADASPPIPLGDVASEHSEAHDRPAMAAGVIILAMFILGGLDNSVSVIARDTGLWQFHFIRACIAVSLMVGMARFGFINITPKRRWAVALRGGMTAIAMLVYFGCLAFLPLGQVAAGLFTAPIWVMLLSAVFLKQKVGPTRLVAAAIGFVGVLLVLRPFEGGLNTLALVPMIAGFFYACGAIATRQWCVGESAMSMLLFFFISLGVFGLLGATFLTLWPHDVPAGPDGFILRGFGEMGGLSIGLTILQAVGSMIAVGLVFKGYLLGDAAQVAIYEYSLLVFAAGWSYLLFDQSVTPMSVIGMGFIILSGIVISLRSRGA